MRTRGTCKGCDEERELVDGVCATCWQELKVVQKSLKPIVDEMIEGARETAIGKPIVEMFEDWAAGYKARKAREKRGP